MSVKKLSSQVRVAYVIGQLAPAGTEYQLVELVRHLNRDKFKVLVICLSAQAELSGLLIEAGCEVHILHRETRGRMLVLWDIYHLLRAFEPDIVHSFGYASRAVLPVSKLFFKARNIVSIRTQPTRVLWVDELLDSFADRILTNSRKAAALIGLGLQKNVPCQVIYNGIDLHRFDLEAASDLAVPKGRRDDVKLPVEHGTKVIGVVARLHPVKGLHVLLDAFAIVSKVCHNIQLWVIGDGVEREKLESQAERLGITPSIVFWGQQTNIPAMLNRVDMGVLSSYVEGLPNAIIEYMAAKRPVVATDVGGMSELVVHQETGLLVPAGDAGALADAMLTILKNPKLAEQYGQAGRQRVAELFTLEQTVRETENVYEQLWTR